MVFAHLSNTITTDKERPVVMAALIATKEIIESCGLNSMANKHEDLKVR